MLRRLVLIFLNVFLFIGVAHAQQNSSQTSMVDPRVKSYNNCIQDCLSNSNVKQCQDNCDMKFPGVAKG